ncbi:DUF4287 domain-containing protein [Pontibacter sp. G13]|uniref:DUF4287 domain-containing protein n=1 Tax=Pontibacter sp. G13 TaxID=3074898 RepID=UPI00288AAD2B|nr:DUF4287 domain-containing protein [Pontibacter sp. G13]WNJ20318.1 DUF4287 domain-containing protein [Pontibacter sp. G13]
MKRTISEESILKATGQQWDEWFHLMDAAQCTEMSHKEMAQWLETEHGVSMWWCQAITVQYERERGLRKVNEKIGGFEVSVSKTVQMPIEELYERVHGWFLALPDIEIRVANPNKNMRITWPDTTNVVVHVWDKGPAKSQVVVMHEKLSTQELVEPTRAYWKAQIPLMVDFEA